MDHFIVIKSGSGFTAVKQNYSMSKNGRYRLNPSNTQASLKQLTALIA